MDSGSGMNNMKTKSSIEGTSSTSVIRQPCKSLVDICLETVEKNDLHGHINPSASNYFEIRRKEFKRGPEVQGEGSQVEAKDGHGGKGWSKYIGPKMIEGSALIVMLLKVLLIIFLIIQCRQTLPGDEWKLDRDTSGAGISGEIGNDENPELWNGTIWN